jgi:leucyl aminopeptidase
MVPAVAAAGPAGAQLNVVEGDALLEANWPAVHTVGRAAARPPVVLDITWQPSSSSSSSSEADLPLVVLVGKGVCFDSGGKWWVM